MTRLTIHLPIADDQLTTLAARAAAEGVTVESLVESALAPALPPLLDGLTRGGQTLPSPDAARAARREAFDAWVREAQTRRGRLPPGYEADDSREAIYEGVGE